MTRGSWRLWCMGSLFCAFLLAAIAGCVDGGSDASDGGHPSVSGNPATQVEVGELYSFTPAASGPSGQELAYSIQNKPSWASFSIATGELTGIPTNADIGAYPGIQISANTAATSTALRAFTINVIAGQAVAVDAYGGVAATNCTNPNGSSYFGLAMIGKHKVLCDPSGHPYFGRGFYVFDYASLGTDENGGNYNSYVTAKFGASDTAYTWDTQEVARMKSWGFNMIGPDATSYALASWPWSGGGTNPNKVPFVLTEEACYYSWSNRNGWGTAPVKDVLSTASPNWKGTGYYGYQGTTDYEDPAWTNYVNGEMSANGDDYFSNVLAANSTDKSYLIGVFGCDTDYTHGFDGGPDFVTSPSAGNSDFRLSYELALGSPVEWASTHQRQIYADSTVYGKKALHDQVVGEYGNIAALNLAWGSNYTTFGTSGTCYGSKFPTWICPSPSAATSVGVGNGSTVTFTASLNPMVAANSLGIFVAGVLVGGDGGNGPFSGSSGTIYGPHLSGTVNYSTGALTITFSDGSAPASGAEIAAEYIANGWGVGTGLMDEDGRASHQTWIGNNSVCIDGVGAASSCSEGGNGKSYASSGVVSDLNRLDESIAGLFGTTYKAAITAHFPGALFLGTLTFGTWNNPPNRYVIEGLAPHQDVGVFSASGTGISQAELDFVHQYAGDMALGLGTYNTANLDSPFAWPKSNCTHSGLTVTCAISSPQNLSTSWSVMTRCSDPSYNVSAIRPSSVGISTVVYSADTSPVNASTICTVALDDSQQSSYGTMAARAAAVGNELEGLPNSTYTADGVAPYVMALWWQWSDKQGEELSWGVVDTRDNAYNGVETTTSSVPCSPPLQAYTCGGELRKGWGSSDGITPLSNANSAIDQALAAVH